MAMGLALAHAPQGGGHANPAQPGGSPQPALGRTAWGLSLWDWLAVSNSLHCCPLLLAGLARSIDSLAYSATTY